MEGIGYNFDISLLRSLLDILANGSYKHPAPTELSAFVSKRSVAALFRLAQYFWSWKILSIIRQNVGSSKNLLLSGVER
jgi:hypothetical protein